MELSNTTAGSVEIYRHCGDPLTNPKIKFNIKLLYNPVIPLLDVYTPKTEVTQTLIPQCSQQYYSYNQKVEETYGSSNRVVDKQNVLCPHNEILFCHEIWEVLTHTAT